MATVEKCGLDDAFARGMSRADVDRLIVDRLPDLPSTERAALRPVYRYMSAVTPQRVEWLWDGYIVRRKLNLLAGYGGVGKGQMSCSLIARLSRGDPLPNSDHRVTARTLILAAEDSPEEDLWWRLTANGADMDNIIILDGMAASDGVLSWVDVQKHASAIAHVIRTESIDLLYIDPASSYMPGTDRNSQGAVRDALGHVQRIINDTGVTVLATVHLGKAAERKGAQRILGSVEFVNLARNVLAINDLPDEHQPDDVLEDETLGRRKVLQVVKCNSGIPGPPLSFSRPLDAAVVWHGVAPVGFDQSFETSEPKGKQRQDAMDWLSDPLEGGMRPQSDIEHAATEANITKAMLRRAKEGLNVKSKKVGFPGTWQGHLPTPEAAEVHSPNGRIEDAHLSTVPDHTEEVSVFEDAHPRNVSTFVQAAEDAHMIEHLSTFAPDPEGAHMTLNRGSEHLRTLHREELGCELPDPMGSGAARPGEIEL